MAKIEIERKADHLKIAVMNLQDVLVGYAFVGNDGNGGYQINCIESWAGPNNKISISKNVFNKLSIARFKKEMNSVQTN